MDLRLLDSDDKPLASEVVPLAHSYHVRKFEPGQLPTAPTECNTGGSPECTGGLPNVY